MSAFIQFKTNHGDIWSHPSAVIGVAQETTHEKPSGRRKKKAIAARKRAIRRTRALGL